MWGIALSAEIAWLAAGLAGLTALALAGLWRRALAEQRRAEIERYAAERAREAAEGRSRQQAAQLAALQLAQADASLLIDQARVVVDLNLAARGLFGPRAAPGQTVIMATRSVELDEMAAHVLAGGEDRDRQVLINNQPFRVRAMPAGEHGLAVVLKDLSELQRLGRARRDFIANISHELRTPLTSIRLLVESLLAGVAREPAAAADLLEKINTEVHALEQMAQELLDLAQIESGQAIVRLLPTPVDQLVHATVERLRPQAERKGLDLQLGVPADIMALADADLLNRALGNLIHNAIKFTPAGGRVSVTATAEAEEVRIVVADTGPGIPAADLPRVFERFFRGDRARTGSGGGTGLGLAIAKHVVEAHGGRLWVESPGQPGLGAKFFLTLLPSDAG